MTAVHDRRTVLRWSGLALAGIVLTDGCSSGGPDSALDRIRAGGRVRVAVADEEPYGFVDAEGALTGAFPELVRAVVANLGIERLDGVVVPFGSLIDTLVAGRADVVAAGMTVTSERCTRVEFGRPDLRSLTALAVRSGNPLGLSDYASLVGTGATVGVLAGAVEADDTRAAGVGEDRIVTFADVDAMLPALVSGGIDAIALTARTLRGLAAGAVAGNVEVLAPFTPVIGGEPQERLAALAFPRDDRSFLDAFEAAAEPLRVDGTIAAIFRRFGWTDADLPTPGQRLACR